MSVTETAAFAAETSETPMSAPSRWRSRLPRRLRTAGKWALIIVVLDMMAWIVGLILTATYWDDLFGSL